MKTTEEYIDAYNNKLSELSEKGEQRRIQFSLQEFLEKIEIIRKFELAEIENEGFPIIDIENRTSKMISILLTGEFTIEEMKEEFGRHKAETADQLEIDVPNLQEILSGIKTPLRISDVETLYSGLLHNQITLEMIEEKVLEEFKMTRQYQKIIRIKNIPH